VNSAGYIELIQRVGEISQEPQYKKDFYDLVLDVFDNKSYDSLKELYEYVIGDFKITDFVLKTEL